jgi:FtsH-binding integral membrane protein
MRPWTARAFAVGVDALCLAIFVALGRASHDIASGIDWYLTVLWPFLVGWFVVALVLQLYKAPVDRWVILSCTWVLGSTIGLILRAAVTHRSTPLAFVIVTLLFIGLTTFGWRLFVHGLAWVRSHERNSPRLS